MRRVSSQALLVMALLTAGCVWWVLSAFAAGENHLAIYAPPANYSLSLYQYKGQDYVGLFEILEPLGSVQAKTSGSRWRLRFDKTEAEFHAGDSKCKIGGKEVPLSGVFLLQNNRGLIPLTSLSAVLPRFLVWPIDFHEKSRRLFLGDTGVHFTAQAEGQPPALALNFSTPVSPAISTSGNELRMTFTREPLRSPPSDTMTFPIAATPSASYREESGSAEIVVHGTGPLFARFSNNGQTITVTPAPVAVTQPPPNPVAPSPTGPSLPPPPAAQIPAPRQYFAVVDAAHGGDDPGTLFSPDLAEKSVTLALARRIRQELESRGIATLLIRDGDYAVSFDQRANIANGSRATIYIAVHASPEGHGLRIYRGLAPGVAAAKGPFLDWSSAQSSFVSKSETAAESIAAEAVNQKMTVQTSLAPLRPLNNVTAAAIAVEAAPAGNGIAELTARNYQQQVTAIVAAGVAAWRGKLGGNP